MESGMVDSELNRRFASATDAEIQKNFEEKDAKNTKRAALVAANAFRAYLREKGLRDDFATYSSSELDSVLSKFYVEARTKSGQRYKKLTMISIRHGLNRILDFDIVNGQEFSKSREVFSAVMIDLKRQGLGGIGTNTADGRMYEIKDADEKCPVKTFVRYKRMLPVGCDYLFPRCRKTPSKDGCYFDNAPMGHNKLGKMMTSLSEKAGVSKKYTNHSLRATSVHLLDSAQIPTRHIMSVTGHKAEASLKTYTGYTSEATKRRMSDTISESTEIAKIK